MILTTMFFLIFVGILIGMAVEYSLNQPRKPKRDSRGRFVK